MGGGIRVEGLGGNKEVEISSCGASKELEKRDK